MNSKHFTEFHGCPGCHAVGFQISSGRFISGCACLAPVTIKSGHQISLLVLNFVCNYAIDSGCFRSPFPPRISNFKWSCYFWLCLFRACDNEIRSPNIAVRFQLCIQLFRGAFGRNSQPTSDSKSQTVVLFLAVFV